MTARSPVTSDKDYSVPLEEGLEMLSNASVHAVSRLKDVGLSDVYQRPKVRGGKFFDGRLPSDINDMSLAGLGEQFTLMEQWFTYVSKVYKQAKAEATNTDRQVKLTRAKVRKTYRGSESEKDDDVLCDLRYCKALAVWLEAQEFYDLVTSVYDAADRDLKFISRLIELKKLEKDVGNREGNINGRGRKPVRDRLTRG